MSTKTRPLIFALFLAAGCLYILISAALRLEGIEHELASRSSILHLWVRAS